MYSVSNVLFRGLDTPPVQCSCNIVRLYCCRPSVGKRTSLSVLSPFDEAEEWSKILEILNSCSTGLDAAEDGASGDGGSDGSHLLGAVQREFQNRLGELWFFFQFNCGDWLIISIIDFQSISVARIDDLP